MKAVILHGPGKVSVGEFPTPTPKAGEVRVRVAFCGICGSDFHKVHHAAACLMRSKELPRDSFDIADILRSRDYFFDVSGTLLFPYEY